MPPRVVGCKRLLGGIFELNVQPCTLRRVSHAGTFRLHATQPFLSRALRDEYIGLDEVADGIWNIVYFSTLLGKIDERTLLITGV